MNFVKKAAMYELDFLTLWPGMQGCARSGGKALSEFSAGRFTVEGLVFSGWASRFGVQGLESRLVRVLWGGIYTYIYICTNITYIYMYT